MYDGCEPRTQALLPCLKNLIFKSLHNTPPVLFTSALSLEHAGAAWQHLNASNALLVADANTYAALGEKLSAMLESDAHIFPTPPRADMATVETITSISEGYDALIAVGSGTISDLCKLAAHRRNISYLMAATAPSMNGYLSITASILSEGIKTSHTARLPASVLCDLSVLSVAPKRLRLAGLGDCLARPTAQADWLLSHLLHGTHYDEAPYQLQAPYETEAFGHARAIANGEPHAVAALMRLLLAAGMGMTVAGSSHPASGGEHAIAHAYESLADPGTPYHGEQIGVTTLTLARLQHKLLPTLPADLQPRLRGVMLPVERLEQVLQDAGAPMTVRELGWDETVYKQAVQLAPKIRERFGFLNLI